MELLSWSQGYTVYNEELDRHHEQLFNMLNRAYEYVMSSREVESILPMIDELSDYTRYHFTTEEQYMREQGFPELAGHMEKHKEFSYTIDTLRSRYHDNDLEVARELIIILGEWLLCHVLKEDMKYAASSSGTA